VHVGALSCHQPNTDDRRHRRCGEHRPNPRGPRPGGPTLISVTIPARNPVTKGSPNTWRPNPSLLGLSRCPSGCPPGGPRTPSRGLRRSPAKEHRDTCRTKTQDGTFLASENRERPLRPTTRFLVPPRYLPGSPLASEAAPSHISRPASPTDHTLSSTAVTRSCSMGLWRSGAVPWGLAHGARYQVSDAGRVPWGLAFGSGSMGFRSR
jgi:hypothetical protein